MNTQVAREEYLQALKQGQKEQKILTAAGKNPYPAVLDEILTDRAVNARELGTLEIPASRIVGTTTAGRIGAFTAEFRPLLNSNSEFAAKWIALCADHLSEEGIRDPILCYEYLGNFYVQEGNKRVSVLRHFGAPRISATVRRILPPVSDEPRIQAYYEFLDFYEAARIYSVQYRRPGDYALLLSHLGKEPGEIWNERERRTFTAYFQYFREAFAAQRSHFGDLLPEEALLLWLQVYSFPDLGQMTATQLKKSLTGLKAELQSMSRQTAVELKLEPDPEKTSILNMLNPVKPEYIRVAFVHALSPEQSEWIDGHDQGRKYLEEVMGDLVRVRSYFHADSPAMAEALLEQAVADGANIVFTTTPQLGRHTLRMAVKYPKVKFLNCSVNLPYSSFRSYYGRIYEAKFITGAIAGAMSKSDRIGYIGTSPIWGVPASVNAFALGAQLTNPNARVCLKWSCLPGSHQDDLFRDGIRVISNKESLAKENYRLDGCSYGTYLLDGDNLLQPLATPVWVWGKFYVAEIRALLAGTRDNGKTKPVNYWWGMESGLIDLNLSPHLPEGVQVLANTLRDALIHDRIHPFCRRIIAQDGTVKNDGSRNLNVDELLRMNWLCENVEGHIPEFDELLPFARGLVRQQGIYPERIPKEKEGTL